MSRLQSSLGVVVCLIAAVEAGHRHAQPAIQASVASAAPRISVAQVTLDLTKFAASDFGDSDAAAQ